MNVNAQVSRRHFIAATGAAAVAGVAVPAALASEPAEQTTPAWDEVCDVLVIGFGGAGGCAAIAAADEGAKVLLVDKAPQYLEGGNTRYSEQFLLGWEDEAVDYEFMVGMADGCQDMTDDILHLIAEETTKTPAWIEAHGGSVGVYNTTLPDRATFDKVFSTGNAPDLLMSDWVAEQSDGTYSFFEYNHWPNNGTLNDYQISHSYMVDNAPAHKGYWEWLRRTVESYSDSITCWFNAPAVKLLQDGATKAVTGAVVNHNGEEVRVCARNGVVLACGSYEADLSKLETYAARTGALFVGSAYNTGDGIDMAGALGAQMWHMGCLSGPFVNPPMPNGTKAFWCGGGLNRPCTSHGAIFVDSTGNRFMPEHSMNHHGFMPVGDSYQNMQLPKKFFAIVDEEGLSTSQFWGKPSYMVVDEEQICSGQTPAELAEQLGIDAEGLEATIAQWNSDCDAGFDSQYARNPGTLKRIDGPLYGIEYRAAFVNAQGGPKRNVECAVLDYGDQPIPHLYSAGELGSFWGGIYIAGGNVAETCYSGRIAGRNAAQPKDDAVAAKLTSPSNDITPYDEEAIAASYPCAENEFVGSALGIHGPVVVKVSVEDGALTNVEVLSQFESPEIVRDLFTAMPKRMVEANSVEVDGATGASIATRALRDAVTNALAKAGITPQDAE